MKDLGNIKLVVFDVDGVFTDGTFYLDEAGRELLKFSRVDGKGIELLRHAGIKTAVVTGEAAQAYRLRMEKLQIDEVRIGAPVKDGIFEELLKKFGCAPEETAVLGDDLQDLPMLRAAGFAACPRNAQDEVKTACDFVSQRTGGENFVREICNMILSEKARE